MLLKGIAVISLLLSCIICAVSGIFWLWAVALFAGLYLLGVVIALAFLWICCNAVDMESEQENDSKFYRTLTYLWIDFVIAVGRVKIICKGAEKLPKDGRFLLVCNHQADIDPALLMKC